MNPKIKEHIEQLDIEKGGGIISEKIRVGTIDNPMLVIGLGGTGIDALLRVKYMIHRRFNLPRIPGSSKYEEKPKNIEFLGIETNFADKDKKYPDSSGVGLNPDSELILLSSMSIAPILSSRQLMDDCIKEWISPDLKPADGTRGAGGIRQLGRLMLFTKMNEVVQSLRTKINALTPGTNSKFIVFILSGLSGGTGSGCFIDVPYIIRGLFEKMYGAAAAGQLEILGYLFTPDVNLSRSGITPFEENYIEKNGFAALKELDYWMNVGQRGDNFVQNYKNILTVNTNMPPFNLCHLISAHNIHHTRLVGAYDYCMNVTAENITNFMANEEKIGDQFAIHDYLSNVGTLKSGMTRPYNVNYEYSILGAASAVLPIEDITTYLAFKLFKIMKDMFDMSPAQKEVEEILKELRLDKDSLSKRFDDGAAEPLKGFEQNPRIFNYDNVIRSDFAGIMNSLENYVKKSEERYLNCSSQLPSGMAANFKKKVEELFTQSDKGPFFVSRLIHSNSGFDIIKRLKAIVENIENELKGMDESIRVLEQTSVLKFNDAKGAIINRERKKNDYIYARINEFKKKAYAIKLQEMKAFYNRLIPLINEYNNNIYSTVTETLNELNKIFESNGRVLTESYENHDKNTTTYYWNIISIPSISKTIDKIIDKEKTDILLNDFLTTLLKQIRQWIDESELGIVDTISDFLSDKFSEIISKSMEDFLIMQYGENMNMNDIVRKIASDLNEKAVPVYHMDSVGKTVNFPSWGIISLPMKSPKIKAGILEYQKNALGNNNFTIKESKVTNRIFWLNTYIGVPLYNYLPIKMYEAAYEEGIDKPEHQGRHLVQSEKEDWTNLPSPIPQDSWGEKYCNDRLKRINDNIRQMFDRGIKEKPACIKANVNSGKVAVHQCIETEEFSIDEFMSSYEINLNNQEQIRYDELKRCINDLSRILDEGLKERSTYSIFDSASEEAAKDNLIRTPKLVKVLEKELVKYDSIRNKISELQSIVQKGKDEEERINTLFRAIFTNAICRKGFNYVYDQDENEKGDFPAFAQKGSSKNIEYEIYEKYNSLDEKSRKQINDKAAKRYDKMTFDEDAMNGRINELTEQYKKEVEEIENNLGRNVDDDKYLDLYKKLLKELKELS